MIFNFIDKIKSFLKEIKSSGKVQTKTPKNNLEKNFLKKDDSGQSDYIARKTQSMSDSQGVSDFSGSGYKGPGNVDREKVNSNMSQRNFER